MIICTCIIINTKCEPRSQVRDAHIKRIYGSCGANEYHTALPQHPHTFELCCTLHLTQTKLFILHISNIR